MNILPGTRCALLLIWIIICLKNQPDIASLKDISLLDTIHPNKAFQAEYPPVPVSASARALRSELGVAASEPEPANIRPVCPHWTLQCPAPGVLTRLARPGMAGHANNTTVEV